MATKAEIVSALAKRVVQLHEHPNKDPDIANRELEAAALKLAAAVLFKPGGK